MAYKNPEQGILATWLSPAQMAKRLGSCEATVRSMLRRKTIPAVQIGSRWRVDPAVFDAWLAGRAPAEAQQPRESQPKTEPEEKP